MIIANINGYNNGYDKIINTDSFLQLCIKSIKRLENENIEYRFFNYDSKEVLEAKEICKDYLKNINIIENPKKQAVSQITDGLLNLGISVGTLRTYIQTIIPNLIFLDTDVFIYNKVKFLNSVKNKVSYHGTLLDMQASNNADNLDLFKKIFDFRINNNISNINFNSREMLTKISSIVKINNKIKGIIHISKFGKKFQNIYIVKNNNDLKNIFNLNPEYSFILVFKEKDEITIKKINSKFKILNLEECDEFSREAIITFLKKKR